MDQINQFTCNCDAGFTGVTCDVDVNECLLNTSNCGNGRETNLHFLGLKFVEQARTITA